MPRRLSESERAWIETLFGLKRKTTRLTRVRAEAWYGEWLAPPVSREVQAFCDAMSKAMARRKEWGTR